MLECTAVLKEKRSPTAIGVKNRPINTAEDGREACRK